MQVHLVADVVRKTAEKAENVATSAVEVCVGAILPQMNTSLEVVLTMVFIGILMQYGPPAWVAYGTAGVAGGVFLLRLFYLVGHPDNSVGPPRWCLLPKVLILLEYGFFFFIRDQFGLMWVALGAVFLLIGIRLLS